MNKHIRTPLAAALLLAAAAVQAAPWVFDITGAEGRGEIGTAGNTVLTFGIGANAEVVAFSFDVTVTSFAPSWLSEAGVYVDGSALDAGFAWQPGAGVDDVTGTMTYKGRVDLAAENLALRMGSDGLLRLEFYDSYLDAAAVPNSRWAAGTLTFEVAAVPEPSTCALMALGVAALGLAVRRRGGVLKSTA